MNIFPPYCKPNR